MERRSFLGSLAAFAATLTLDPEKLLWIPGKKHISIPSKVMYGDSYQILMQFSDGLWRPVACNHEQKKAESEFARHQRDFHRKIRRDIGLCCGNVEGPNSEDPNYIKLYSKYDPNQLKPTVTGEKEVAIRYEIPSL